LLLGTSKLLLADVEIVAADVEFVAADVQFVAANIQFVAAAVQFVAVAVQFVAADVVCKCCVVVFLTEIVTCNLFIPCTHYLIHVVSFAVLLFVLQWQVKLLWSMLLHNFSTEVFLPKKLQCWRVFLFHKMK